MQTPMSDISTAPSTGIDEVPREVENSVMRAPTVEAARAIIAMLDERPNV